MSSSATTLLIEVARCPNVSSCLNAPNEPHPCQTVVRCTGTSVISTPRSRAVEWADRERAYLVREFQPVLQSSRALPDRVVV